MNVLDNLMCVLLHGPSGAGKSETAKLIAAPDGVRAERIRGHHKFFYDHRTLAAPLNEMYSVKINTAGADLDTRQLWLLHDVFTDLFVPNSVDFTDFIELIYDTQACPINLVKNAHGNYVKDRDFMTSTADACHALSPNVFANYLTRSIGKNHRDLIRQVNDDLTPYKNIVMVSDLRLRPELESFMGLQELGAQIITIRLDVSYIEQDTRLLERDNCILTEKQKKHETQISPFVDDDFDLIIDTEKYDLSSQVLAVDTFISNKILSNS